MPIKSIIALVIFVVFVLPSLLSFMSFTLSSITSSPEKVAKDGAKLIAEETVPWWVGVIDWLVKLPLQIAPFLILGFIGLLIWVKAF